MNRAVSVVGVLCVLLFARCSQPAYTLSDGVLMFDTVCVRLDSNHLLLDGSLADTACGSPFLFNDIVSLTDYLNSSNDTLPTYVYVAPWVYLVDNPDTPQVKHPQDFFVPIGATIRHDKLNVIGVTGDPSDVVMASARGQMQGAVGNFTMFRFIGDDLTFRNVTLGNYCNVDLLYKPNPQLSRKKRSDAITQAQLAFVEGDRAQAHNCRFVSRLNTNPLNGAKRTLFVDCHFEMTDDALEGRGVYLGCLFDFYAGKPFYSTYGTGAVMLDCDFNIKHKEQQSFTKVEGQLAVVDCRYHNPHDVDIQWTLSPSGMCVCYQHNVTANGEPIVISDDERTTVVMDSLPLLRAYKLDDGSYNLYNLLAGDDGWNPMNSRETERLPVMMALQSDADSVVCGGVSCNSRAIFRMMGSERDVRYKGEVEWRTAGDASAVLLSRVDNVTASLVGNNEAYDDTLSVVQAVSDLGHRALAQVVSRPSLLVEPLVEQSPTIRRDGDTLKIDYRLSQVNGKDRSRISWFRLVGGRRYPLAESHSTPTRSYTLCKADNGCEILAEVSLGSGRTLRYADYILRTTDTRNGDDGRHLSTDFASFPVATQSAVAPGVWTVDWYKPQDVSEYSWSAPDTARPYWIYTSGVDGAKGREGLFQAQKGARLFYTPTGDSHGDMRVEWTLVPCKSAGQGFGSATGQYLDLYIKFDLGTLTGYALRIERTPRSSSAVDFSLVRYTNGVVERITDAVTAGCFRADCKVEMEIAGREFNVLVYNAQSDKYGRVVLNATVETNHFGGFGMQHTGSCGASATMLHKLNVEYNP